MLPLPLRQEGTPTFSQSLFIRASVWHTVMVFSFFLSSPALAGFNNASEVTWLRDRFDRFSNSGTMALVLSKEGRYQDYPPGNNFCTRKENARPRSITDIFSFLEHEAATCSLNLPINVPYCVFHGIVGSLRNGETTCPFPPPPRLPCNLMIKRPRKIVVRESGDVITGLR